jgi:hypothetical protein
MDTLYSYTLLLHDIGLVLNTEYSVAERLHLKWLEDSALADLEAEDRHGSRPILSPSAALEICSM